MPRTSAFDLARPAGPGYTLAMPPAKTLPAKMPPVPTPAQPQAKTPFWRAKALEDMTRTEWESLCDGCGRCCLIKLEDEDTGDIHHTDIACALFNSATCRCRDYPNRAKKVPDCVTLTPHEVRTLTWLPPTCAYRLVAEGRDLYDWHHLKSGSRQTVHEAGVSVQGRVFCGEDDLPLDRWQDRVRQWPKKVPRVRKARSL